MESQAEKAAADKGLTCPGCGHVNPAGLTRCERCTGPLIMPTGHYYANPNQRPDRPGCVTIFALLLMIPFCLYVPAACYWSVNLLPPTQIPIWPPAVFIIITILVLAAILLAIISLTLALGLWQQKNWARVAVIGLIGISIMFTVCNLAFTLLRYIPGASKAITLGASLAILAVQGYIVYWFAQNKECFE